MSVRYAMWHPLESVFHRCIVLPDGHGMAPEPCRRGHRRGFQVDLAGSNVTGDGSQAHPWRSIPFAVTSVPNGTAGNPAVIHAAPGEFAETSDGSKGQLLIASRQFVQIEGAGPSTGAAGTRISTQGFLKRNPSGILRVRSSTGIEVRNLIIGDDCNWSQADTASGVGDGIPEVPPAFRHVSAQAGAIASE